MKSEVPELVSTPFILRGSDETRLEMYAKMYYTITTPKNIKSVVMTQRIRLISPPIMFVAYMKRRSFLVSVKLETTVTSRESIEVQLMNHVT